ncbi:hypothetical protein WA538_000921, partial [Blastocystis sp. DL]
MDSMDTIQEIGIAYWKAVEDFYKSITPRVNGIDQRIEKETNIPLHYYLMLFTCFFIFLLYLCMRKCCLSNVVIVVCALIPFIRDSINRRDQRKWISLWIFIATLEVFSRPLSVIYFSGIVKIALSVYFIYFDREQYLQRMYNFILQKIASLQPSKEKV